MLVCAITATLAPTLAPPTASACQREPPGVRSRQVLPADGATGVPTNTRIAVEYLASDIEIAPSLALRTEGGTFVPHDVVSEEEGNSPTFVIAPRARLAPGTRYWIYDRIRLERECAATGGVPCTGEPLAFATFTTGATADTTPPTSTGVAIETHYVSAEQNSCGPYGEVTHSGVVHDIADDSPIETLRYDHFDTAGRRLYTGRSGVGTFHRCPPGPEDVDTFVVRVVDMAGNQGPVHVVRGRSCADFEGGCNAGGGAGLLVGLAALAGLRIRRRPERDAARRPLRCERAATTAGASTRQR
jgi:hypothetical protein